MMSDSGAGSVTQNPETYTDTVPEDELIRFKWKDLSGLYASKPRLSNTLSSSSLEISEKDGCKHVTFTVQNVAQKEWIESKLLHELEKSFRKIINSDKIYLHVSVSADSGESVQIKYMPSEQAKDLMSQNEEVKNLVRDFELDVK